MHSVYTGTISNTDVDTAEEVAIISNVHVDGQSHETLWISFVVSTADLSAFTVEYRTHSSGSYFTVASAAADYTSPEGPILGASGDLTIAAAGATVHWLSLNIRGIESVRLKAAGTSSVIAGNYSKG